jgi:hypothetical protein
MSPPKAYRTIPGTGHYLGSVNFFGGPVILYDEVLVGEVVSAIDGWLRGEELPPEHGADLPPAIVTEPPRVETPETVHASTFPG